MFKQKSHNCSFAFEPCKISIFFLLENSTDPTFILIQQKNSQTNEKHTKNSYSKTDRTINFSPVQKEKLSQCSLSIAQKVIITIINTKI
ncbi:hypothetical protein DHL47_05110 [Streptococcus panodentis]|uniref:Uncharacterized protein n=1 Tax=Streptococcus panodentis TaxID=1581472 RepID=A0ABS5AVY2_9STRE|nr:hypothetical protein [Streptococcus panodentis]